jgi:hypothetical protein
MTAIAISLEERENSEGPEDSFRGSLEAGQDPEFHHS